MAGQENLVVIKNKCTSQENLVVIKNKCSSPASLPHLTCGLTARSPKSCKSPVHVLPDEHALPSARVLCAFQQQEVVGTDGSDMATVYQAPNHRVQVRRAECCISSKERAAAPRGALQDGSRLGEEHAWMAPISQHIKSGQKRKAMKLYEGMRKDGVKMTPHAFVALLQACNGLQDLGIAKQIHADIVRNGFENNLYVGTMLVNAYAKCGSLENARQVFERLPHRDVVSWTAIILGYAQKEKGEEALQLYGRMQQEGVVPNDRTYVGVLKACSTIMEVRERNGGDAMLVRSQCLQTVRDVHADVKKRKLELNVFVGNKLVDAYSKCGSLVDARRVFDNMPVHTVVSWSAMILGYAQMEMGEEALQLYTRMLQEGFVPNDRTFVGALKACSSLAECVVKNGVHSKRSRKQCLETVRIIHADAQKEKLDLNMFVGNMLVDAYAKCGSLEDARQVFNKMTHRDTISWNSIILGYSQMERGEEALQLYSQMRQEGVVPNDRTYVAALKACSTTAELGNLDGGDGLAKKKQCLETVTAIHADVKRGKFELDIFVGTMLVDAYAKCGSLENARQVFDAMPRRDVVSWTAMILVYVQLDKGEEALHLYTRMQKEGVAPNDRTYVGALNACGSVAELERGKEIHDQMLKAGLELDSYMLNSLIDMYGKCSSMVDAQQVFDAIPSRDVVAWNALISGYARQGESDVVFNLFRRLQEEGVQANDITLLAVLSVCSHVGLVHRAQKYFEAMKSEYDITPTIQHYNCMVDLLGRAGRVDEAMEMVKRMPFEPDITLWKSVLGACQKWGDVEIGKQAFECAVRVDKSDTAPYVLMSNIYTAAHMPEEAQKIQGVRLKSRVWKEPGRSWWVDMSGTTHVFVVGDQAHPDSQDVYAKLGALMASLKTEGYVSHLDPPVQEMSEEEMAEAVQ